MENFKEFFVQDGTVEYFNDSLVVLSSSVISVKDLSKGVCRQSEQRYPR